MKEIFYTLQGEGAQAGRPAVLPLQQVQPVEWPREDRAASICNFVTPILMVRMAKTVGYTAKSSSQKNSLIVA